jgi:hypothetical protein
MSYPFWPNPHQPDDGPNDDWSPSSYPADPHEDAYLDAGEGGWPVTGPVAPNIHGD